MSNIHFVNARTKKHEFCDMKSWVLMHAQTLTAVMITACKIVNAPVAFPIQGNDGDWYIVADDETYNNPFSMAHEEGHLELGHFEPGAVDVDEHGIINDIDAEKAADRFAIEKTKNPKLAIDTLHNILENINEDGFLDKNLYVTARMQLVDRMLAIANMKI